MKRYEVGLGEQQLTLLGGGGVFWPAHNALLVADLHLGKLPLRRRDRPNWDSMSQAVATLASLAQLLQCSQAANLWILGDLFQARSASARRTLSVWKDFLAARKDLQVTLVLGNHDIYCRSLVENCNLDRIVDELCVDGITLSHFPPEPEPGGQVCIAGHRHPAIACSRTGRRIPCFWLRRGCLTLPAIGALVQHGLIDELSPCQTWRIDVNGTGSESDSPACQGNRL